MKIFRLLLLNLVLLGSLYCSAQRLSIVGIEVGSENSDYQTVEKILKQRYGSVPCIQEDNEITYCNTSVGGIYYNRVRFFFTWSKNKKILTHVCLERDFELNEFEKAKECRDNIAELYVKKYKDLASYIDENGIKQYEGAIQGKYALIKIKLEKSQSIVGTFHYYVTVYYFSSNDYGDDI